MNGGAAKTWEAIFRQLVDLGWTQRPGRRGRGCGSHIQWRSPCGRHIVTSSLNGSGDPRALHNFKSLLRRYGVDI